MVKTQKNRFILPPYSPPLPSSEMMLLRPASIYGIT